MRTAFGDFFPPLFKSHKLALVSFAGGALLSALALTAVVSASVELTRLFEQLYVNRSIDLGVTDILGSLIDAETGYRGFLLAGDPRMLDPYRAASERLPGEVAAFQSLLDGDPRFRDAGRAFVRDVTIPLAGVDARVNEALVGGPDAVRSAADSMAIKDEVDAARRSAGALRALIAAEADNIRLKRADTLRELLTTAALAAAGLFLTTVAQLRELVLRGAEALRERNRSRELIGDLSLRLDKTRLEQDEINLRLKMALSSALVTILSVDAMGWIDWVSESSTDFLGGAVLPAELCALCPPEDRAGVGERLVAALRADAATEMEIRLGDGVGAARWIMLRISAERRAGSALASAVDITKLKEREVANFWLMRELMHRSRNLMSVLGSVARRSANPSLGTDEFVRRFGERLQAISAVHELLVARRYAGVELTDLASSQTRRDEAPDERVAMSGPRIVVSPEAAQNLAMALHELYANARGHGGLRAPNGEVRLDWSFGASGGDRVVEMHWLERGAAFEAPAHSGFGMFMIRTALPRALGGDVRLDFAGSEMACRMMFPLERLQAREPTFPEHMASRAAGPDADRARQ